MAIQIQTRFPDPHVIGASRETYIFIGASNAVGGISMDTLRVTVAGEVAFEHGDFNRPAFDGSVVMTNNYAAIRVQRRRAFDFSEQVVVLTHITDAQIPPVSTLDDTFQFAVVDAPPTLVNAAELAPCQLRFLSPFPDPNLDFYRQVLGSNLSPNPRLVALLAAYRLEGSASKPLIPSLQLIVPTFLMDRDIGALQDIDPLLQSIDRFWEPALAELQTLGVGPQTVDTLRRSMNSAYPHNRVGAACGATLLAAAFYAAQSL